MDFTENRKLCPFKPSLLLPRGRPPPAGCKMHDSGKVSVKDEPTVWPCSCAARWRVRSERPQSDNTWPLSPSYRKKSSCPDKIKNKCFFEWQKLSNTARRCLTCFKPGKCGNQHQTCNSRNGKTLKSPKQLHFIIDKISPSKSSLLTLQLVSSPCSSIPLCK